MEINNTHYHLRLDQHELVETFKSHALRLTIKAQKKRYEMNHAQFLMSYRWLMNLARQSAYIGGIPKRFDRLSLKIERIFSNEETKLNSPNSVV